MICISVTPESRKLAKVDLINAARHCDMIELCLDYMIKEPDVADLLGAVEKPMLISCRTPAEGGHFKGSEEERQGLLRQAIVAGPAYVELDLESAKKIPRFGETKRVISHTSLDQPLGRVDDIFESARRVNADVVKFTWPTVDLDAAWPLLAAVSKKQDLPVVGIGLGKPGLTFSLLARKFGSPWIYAALEHGMEAYAGQPTVWELEDIYDWRNIGTKTKLVGIVGFGEMQTTTVRVLNAGFRRLQHDRRCLPLQLGELDRLAKMLEVLRIGAVVSSPGWAGRALKFAQQSDTTSRASGYADLLLKQPDGWQAYNTIWRSAVRQIENTLGKKDADDEPLDRRNVVIFGTNGVSRSIAHGIHRRKGLLSFTAPDDDRAQQLAKQFDVRCIPFATVYDTLADVVVIADPNIKPGHHKEELNPTYLRENRLLLDICKMPEDSEFISEARVRGSKIVEPRDVYIDWVGSLFKSLTREELPAEAIEELDA
jgi:3-dehydroquinate dehydratase/shikimate dehydrogenase